MRVRSILAVLVAGMLLAAGVASAQDTTTEPLSDYTTTTPTVTTPPETPAAGVGGEEESSSGSNAPAVASQPAGSAPSSLAFTGADPLLLIALGLGVAGGATVLLVRDRRRSNAQR